MHFQSRRPPWLPEDRNVSSLRRRSSFTARVLYLPGDGGLVDDVTCAGREETNQRPSVVACVSGNVKT